MFGLMLAVSVAAGLLAAAGLMFGVFGGWMLTWTLWSYVYGVGQVEGVLSVAGGVAVMVLSIVVAARLMGRA